jgi:hypothetical protein
VRVKPGRRGHRVRCGSDSSQGPVREVGDDGASPACQPVREGEAEWAVAGPKGGKGCGLLC